VFRESVAKLSEFSNYIELVDSEQRVEMERLQALAGDEVQRQNDVVNATKTSCEEQLMRLQLQFEDVSCKEETLLINNNNNNKHDNVYGAVIMAEPLREFTRFI